MEGIGEHRLEVYDKNAIRIISFRPRSRSLSLFVVETWQEARAKLELREVVTAEMAVDVVNLMRESMLDTLTDEFGGIDFSRTSGNSKKGKMHCA